MRNLTRLLALVVMTGSLAVIDQVTVGAAQCELTEYIEDCNNADNAGYAACQTACWNQYKAGVQSYSGGSCHWYGEEDPNECEENWPNDCGCFRSYTYGQCYCDGI